MAYRRRDEAGVEAELPIVPFLDFSFQLLFFFVINYHPSAMEGQMELSLPAAGEARAESIENMDLNKLPDTDIEVKSELTVVVRTPHDNVNDGTISQISLLGDQGETTGLNVETLRSNLKAVQKNLSSKSEIKIQADSRLKYYFIVQVMDACHRAGFHNISFAPPPDMGTSP
jgi:biopolymer transport protein ExbD